MLGFFGRNFSPATRLSTWRQISLELWGEPRDPTVYGNLEINMTRALEYLRQASQVSGTKITVTHLVAKAIARALAAHPEANAMIAGRRIYMRETVDVYCQVATEGGRDLSGVKVVSADRKTIAELASELASSVKRVQSGDDGSEGTKKAVLRAPAALLGPMIALVDFATYRLQLDLRSLGVAYDQFGSAMVSNVGHFGVDHGLAPLVPRTHAPIVLLVGRIADRPVVVDGHVVAAPCMTVGCTFDHRLIDGFQAGSMECIIRETLEDPLTWLGPPTRPSSTDDRPNRARPDRKSNGPHSNGYRAQSRVSDPNEHRPSAAAGGSPPEGRASRLPANAEPAAPAVRSEPQRPRPPRSSTDRSTGPAGRGAARVRSRTSARARRRALRSRRRSRASLRGRRLQSTRTRRRQRRRSGRVRSQRS